MVKYIIIVNDYAHVNGGAGKVALTSAVALRDRGYDVTVFSAVAPIDKSLVDAGVNVICLEQHDILGNPDRKQAVRQGLWNTEAYRRFNELLDRCPVEETVVHFHSWTKALSASLFKATWEHNSHVVITLHDFFTICPNGGLFNYPRLKICHVKPSSAKCLLCNCDVRNYSQKMFRSLRHLVLQYYLKRNRRLSVCSISKLNEQLIRPHLNCAYRWYFLQNPIDLNVKSSVEIAGNDRYLFMARLSKEKGCEMFCRAITDLGLKGYVLGDGYLREELEARYPNIEFVGWVTGEKKDEYIRRSKALVFPSLWYEGAPLTIVEMKSYGLPCIVPDQCAAAEQIDDGNTGYIFETGNLESLKQAMMKYERTDISQTQNNITSTFDASQFSMDAHVRHVVEIYEDVLGANKEGTPV